MSSISPATPDGAAPRVVHSIAELREVIAELRRAEALAEASFAEAFPIEVSPLEDAEAAVAATEAEPGEAGPSGEAGPASIALVPTMGALHGGHLELVRRAAELADFVVLSIFVNPLQFGEGEDLEAYPRSLDDDLALLTAEGGVDVVFAPSVQEVYPEGGGRVTVSAGAIGDTLEGASRPGHFDGVLTVVTKLFNIVQPDLAVFGKKDAQQLFLVQQLVHDLNLPVRIEAVDIVREDDGLALSSRNRYLDPKQRDLAVLLADALDAAASAADEGVDAVIASAQSALAGESLVTLDYLVIVNPSTFEPVPDDFTGTGLVLVAARVGTTRLIDNETVFVGRR